MSDDKTTNRAIALKLIAVDGRRVGARLAQAVGVSRQVASGYLQGLVQDGLVEAEGTTRARVYRLKTLVSVERRFDRDGLEEDRVWREVVAPHVADLPDNVRNIWHYGATEMINNAIDHSGSAEVQVGLQRNALWTEVVVADEGEGIFARIQRALDLHDPRAAILELAKGKLTTAPEADTGEDICEVFDAFSDPEQYSFDKTVVTLRLAQYAGEKLVSRSQATRVSHRFERFRRVELDFAGISEIGQAFADELFRVFANAHPQIRITPTNTEPPVAQMIQRAVAARAAQTFGGGEA